MGRPKNFEKSQHCWMSSWRGSIEDKVACPYNPKHIMPYRRLLLHIIACAQKNPELAAKFVTCPYNSLHRCHKEQLDDHLKTCQEHQMFTFTRVMCGKNENIQSHKEDPNKVILKEEKTEEMLRLEDEWKRDML